MKKIVIITLMLISFSQISNAQSFWAVNWDIGMGTGDTGKFISETSFRGFTIEGRYFINTKTTIGGSFSWQIFKDNEYVQTPVEIENSGGIIGDISGTQYRYINAYPVLVTGHYYFAESAAVKPYVGIGLGTIYLEERVDVGLISISDDSWGLGVEPAVGMFIPVGMNDFGFNVGVKYTYGTNSGDFTDNFSAFRFSIGFALY